MRAIGNFIWLVFGGFFMRFAWWFFGLLAFMSIIGIPWGKACFEKDSKKSMIFPLNCYDL
ncbi:MAG: hypothetical protein HZB33_14020 [Nitrospirae bacterium]|nr:hypothetical protein [Nitrospirota bacterium]